MKISVYFHTIYLFLLGIVFGFCEHFFEFLIKFENNIPLIPSSKETFGEAKCKKNLNEYFNSYTNLAKLY